MGFLDDINKAFTNVDVDLQKAISDIAAVASRVGVLEAYNNNLQNWLTGVALKSETQTQIDAVKGQLANLQTQLTNLVSLKQTSLIIDPRDLNNEKGFNAVRAWAKTHSITNLDPILVRLSLALNTESSGGYIFANDGSKSPASEIETVQKSLLFPYDKIGSSGGSTGPLQQISKDVVSLRGQTWGWGTLAETMNPASSYKMFVMALNVTTDPVYVHTDPVTKVKTSVATIDPIVADVLRVQQPALASIMSGNYSQARLDTARRMFAGGNRFWTNGGS